MNTPCRVLSDLARHDQETRAQEIEWEMDREMRLYEALEKAHDPQSLRMELDNEFLAPIADAFANLQKAGEEVAGKDMPAVKALLSAVAKCERATVNYLMGE